jgi:hypothetical protein
MKKIIRITVVSAFVTFLLLSGSGVSWTQELVVGLAGPLTGDSAKYGLDLKKVWILRSKN